MNKFILYVMASCPFCHDAEELLRQQNKEFTIVPFDGQGEVLDHIKCAYAHHTVPMIFHMEEKNISFVGGYTDLVTYLNGKE